MSVSSHIKRKQCIWIGGLLIGVMRDCKQRCGFAMACLIQPQHAEFKHIVRFTQMIVVESGCGDQLVQGLFSLDMIANFAINDCERKISGQLAHPITDVLCG